MNITEEHLKDIKKLLMAQITVNKQTLEEMKSIRRELNKWQL